ncbi:MAG: biopolymer transporter ExbD [Flavobacteriales bacterium]|nr:biopolymer transporter ExbD [Flavobacteriales bacterium]MBK9288203.1 biopolymer transporter ExbD [Flavobacteriales bacterium]MBL0036819.1 biopolymer transporter ExbD [Flavobacteriales bacterium]
MRLRKHRREMAEVSTESLNDIMFFLLLFFLIVSTLANPNVVKLTLPSSKQSNQLQKQEVTLSITAEHQYSINKVPVPLEGLEQALRDAVAGLDQPTIVLRLDEALSVQDLVDVLTIGNHIKVKMVLATTPPKG